MTKKSRNLKAVATAFSLPTNVVKILDEFCEEHKVGRSVAIQRALNEMFLREFTNVLQEVTPKSNSAESQDNRLEEKES